MPRIEGIRRIGIEKNSFYIAGGFQKFFKDGLPDALSLIGGIHHHVVDVGDAVIVGQQPTEAD